jgi:hypothetical protein
MFAPPLLDFTGPRVPSARASNRVVVVLPLVPDTHAVGRPAPTSASACGDTWRASFPPIISPEPRPSLRDACEASRSTARAARVRAENRRGKDVVIARSTVPRRRGASSPTPARCGNCGTFGGLRWVARESPAGKHGEAQRRGPRAAGKHPHADRTGRRRGTFRITPRGGAPGGLRGPDRGLGIARDPGGRTIRSITVARTGPGCNYLSGNRSFPDSRSRPPAR